MSNKSPTHDPAAPYLASVEGARGRLQRLTVAWLRACFPEPVVLNRPERGARVIEEAAELAQVLGTSRELAHRLVDRAFDNPVGDAGREVGGMAVVLASAAEVLALDVTECHHRELERLIGSIDATRERHAKKIKQGYTA